MNAAIAAAFPSVDGFVRNSSRATRAAAFTAGTLAAGVCIGGCLALLRAVGLRVPELVALSLALVTLAIAFGAIPDILPSSRWRVPRTWARFGPTQYAFAFGLSLGAGLLTKRPSLAFWLVPLLSLTVGPPLLALFALATFGLARGIVVVRIALAGDAWAAFETATTTRIADVLEIICVGAVFAILFDRLI